MRPVLPERESKLLRKLLDLRFWIITIVAVIIASSFAPSYIFAITLVFPPLIGTLLYRDLQREPAISKDERLSTALTFTVLEILIVALSWALLQLNVNPIIKIAVVAIAVGFLTCLEDVIISKAREKYERRIHTIKKIASELI